MNQLFTKKTFWICLTITSLLSGYLAYNYFDDAFSIMHIDLEMDRHQALEKAKKLCSQQHIGPQEYDNATNFTTDQQGQTFIELAGGGKEILFELIDQDVYQPNTWQVRHFKEYEQHECTIIFKPDGAAYGFVEKLDEQLPGAALSKEEALAIAQTSAQKYWNIAFDTYHLIESSQETKLGGRVDHTFTYEHKRHLEEGRLRLNLCVSGNKLSQVKHFVHVPESFTRTYANMRSSNNTIAWLAKLIMYLLYLLGGCIIGIMILSRKRYVQYKPAIVAAILLSFLLMFVNINNLPLMWISYNTAIGTSTFFMQLVLQLIISFFINALFFSIIFIGAESLTRAAFGNQPQLWKVFSMNASATKDIGAMTLLGYLIVPLLLCFVTLFYYGATKYFGWWLPSSALINPNVLATYAPWLSSLVISLQAGFVEECLFRAVPLASAALIGKKYGRKNMWIFAAFVLQILVFAAAHANYPAQPAFARVIELIFPSTIFGLLYLFFGLLSAIIAHVTYDIVWFALPIFSSHAPSALNNQIMIIFGTALPVFIILYALIRKGALSSLSETFLNKSWIPLPETNEKKYTALIPTEKKLPTYVKCISGTIGIIALILFALFVPKTDNSLPLHESQTEALTFTHDLLSQEATNISSLTGMTREEPDKPIMASHRFVWQELGSDAYKMLLGNYVPQAHWRVRYAQFSGDLLARAEEYQYSLANGKITQQIHIVPEQTELTSLSETEARSLALQTIKKRFSVHANDLEEISAQSYQKPNRLDWIFTFKDTTYPFNKGQARNVVYISGDQVTNTYQTMHIPEEWQRTELERNSIAGTVRMFCFLGMAIMFLLGCALAWYVDGIFAGVSFVLLALLLVLFMLAILANQLPSTFIFFNTSENFIVQLVRMLVGSVLSSVGMGMCLAYAITLIRSYTTKNTLVRSGMNYFLGSSFGFIIAAAQAVITYYIPSLQPLWPEYYMRNTYVPFFAVVSETIDTYLFATLFVLAFAICIHFITRRMFNVHYMLTLPLFMLFATMIFGTQATYNLPLLLATGSICGAILWYAYYFLLQYDFALIPAVTGGYVLLELSKQIIFGNFILSHVVTGVCITFISAWWYKRY